MCSCVGGHKSEPLQIERFRAQTVTLTRKCHCAFVVNLLHGFVA
jgi:hypothetical protein